MKSRIYDSDTKEGIKTIGIYENPSKGYQWYEECRITDEEFIKKADEEWKELPLIVES